MVFGRHRNCEHIKDINNHEYCDICNILFCGKCNDIIINRRRINEAHIVRCSYNCMSSYNWWLRHPSEGRKNIPRYSKGKRNEPDHNHTSLDLNGMHNDDDKYYDDDHVDNLDLLVEYNDDYVDNLDPLVEYNDDYVDNLDPLVEYDNAEETNGKRILRQSEGAISEQIQSIPKQESYTQRQRHIQNEHSPMCSTCTLL